jgi:hypothetical protein
MSLGSNEESETIRVEQIAKGDVISVYGETFQVDHLHDISMAAAPHRHIHIEGARLSNGSRVGLNLYSLDTVERISAPPEDDAKQAGKLTENQIKAKILTTGRALERADWQSMKSEAAYKFCEIHARMGGVHDAAALEKIVTGAMVWVMEGGTAGHAEGEELDAAEIDAQTARPLMYSELSEKQKEEVAARFPATALFRSTHRPLGFDDYVYEVTRDGHVLSRKTIAQYEREIAPLRKPQPEGKKAGAMDI